MGDDGLVQVKCPYTARDQNVSPLSVPYLHVGNGRLALKADYGCNDVYWQTVVCLGGVGS